MRLSSKRMKQCHSHTVGHGMKLPGKDMKHWSLTSYWSKSWDEAQLMRLPGKEIKQCHEHTSDHGMRLPGRGIKQSLTPCWLWDETGLMRLPGKEIKQFH